MAATNDTIDGLLAEFRGYSAGMPASYHVTMSWADFRKILDRLEKANKRERGDCAKLREAVGYILKYADSVACRDHDEHTRHYIDQIRKWAQSALAAPPRNCDRFGGDIEKLREACARERGLNPEEDFPDVFPDWLLAPSTEKKGDAK